MPSSRAHAHGGADVVGVLRLQPEALDPQLRAHAVLAREGDHAPRVLAHHRLGRLAEGLPVRIGAEGVQAGQRRHPRPVADPVRRRPVSGQQADRRRRRPGGDVGDEVADEVDQAALAEGEHLGRRARPAGRRRSARGSASQRQPQRSVEIPKCSGCTQCGSSQKMRSAPVSIAASIHACTKARTRGSLGQPLGVRRPSSRTWPTSRGATVKRLSASPPNIWHTPHGRDLDLEAGVVGGGDDAAHRLAVVGEVVLAEGVQHAGEPARGQLLACRRRRGAGSGCRSRRRPRPQPFTAPAVMPSMSRLRSSRKKITTGSV